jgi:hypothetical protein
MTVHIALFTLAAVGLLAACSPTDNARTDSARAEAATKPATARLGSKANLALVPDDGGWLVVTPSGANDGPGPNPDHVEGVSGQIDLNGDGKPETVQARLGGSMWSEFTIYEGDTADAPILFKGDGIDLLVSDKRDVNGWPVLALRNRDVASDDIGARKIEEQIWTGAKYEPAPKP